jgi:hypothetical protein
MKILFVAPGGSIHTVRWLERAKNNGVDVCLYSQDGIDPNTDFKIYLNKISSGGRGLNAISNLYSEIK